MFFTSPSTCSLVNYLTSESFNMAKPFFTLSFCSLYIVLLASACIAISSDRFNECQLNSLNALEPDHRVESDGGLIETWNSQHPELKCVGVTVCRRTLHRNALHLPSYSPYPQLILIVQGEGALGLSIPGCPQTFEEPSYQYGRRGRQQQPEDRHQKIRQFRQGDVLLIPPGVPYWTYNTADEPLIAVSLLDTSNSRNQLDQSPRVFYLAGNPDSEHPETMQQQAQPRSAGGRKHGQHQQQQEDQDEGGSVLSGFSKHFIAQSFNIHEDIAEKIQSPDDETKQIITVKGGLSVISPKWQEQDEDEDDEQDQPRHHHSHRPSHERREDEDEDEEESRPHRPHRPSHRRREEDEDEDEEESRPHRSHRPRPSHGKREEDEDEEESPPHHSHRPGHGRREEDEDEEESRPHRPHRPRPSHGKSEEVEYEDEEESRPHHPRRPGHGKREEDEDEDEEESRPHHTRRPGYGRHEEDEDEDESRHPPRRPSHGGRHQDEREEDEPGHKSREWRRWRKTRPAPEGEEEEEEVEEEIEEWKLRSRGSKQGNGVEENICSLKLQENIVRPSRANFYNPRAGRISNVNSLTLPALRNLDLSAQYVVLYKNGIYAPHWNLNANSVIYVTRGEGRVRVVNCQGNSVFNGELRRGQLLVVPQNFVVAEQAGEQGFEYIVFKTNHNAITSYVKDVFRAMPSEVLANAFNLRQSQVRSLKYDGNWGPLVNPDSHQSNHLASVV